MAVDRSVPTARDVVFAPLEPAGRAEAVTRRLTDAIVTGLLGDGDALPSEADLAERLGVATVTVREALAALRQAGLLETRRGRGGGSFVRRASDGGVSAQRDRVLALSLAEIRDVGDHYVAIAGTAARLAAERASEDEIDALRSVIDGAPTDGPGALVRAERAFHLELAAATQSPRLTRAEVALAAEFGPLLWMAHDERVRVGAARLVHSDILGALAAGRGDRARGLTEDHVADAVGRLAALHLELNDG